MTELNIIMRQRENYEFVAVLNRLREGNHTTDDINSKSPRLISRDYRCTRWRYFERCFGTNVNVYHLRDDRIALTVYKS